MNLKIPEVRKKYKTAQTVANTIDTLKAFFSSSPNCVKKATQNEPVKNITPNKNQTIQATTQAVEISIILFFLYRDIQNLTMPQHIE